MRVQNERRVCVSESLFGLGSSLHVRTSLQMSCGRRLLRATEGSWTPPEVRLLRNNESIYQKKRGSR